MIRPRNIRNRWALARSYLRRRERLNAFPIEIAIGITNRCNLDCAFCPRGASRHPQGEISLELLDSLIAQVAPFVDVVDLSFDGEPLLHSRWTECVKICHRHRVRALMQTNCLLLDEAAAERVLESGLDAITFSIDAAAAETYQKLKPAGDFERVVANVERFLEIARQRQRSPYTVVQFVRGRENYREAGDFLRYWKGRGADFIRIKPMYNFSGSIDTGNLPSHKKPCILLWTSLSVHWDGSVSLCCMEIEGREVMGDAARQPLMEIVDNKAFRAVRRLHLQGGQASHPLCTGCDVPDVQLPFVLGSIFANDLARRKLIGYAQKLGFIRN